MVFKQFANLQIARRNPGSMKIKEMLYVFSGLGTTEIERHSYQMDSDFELIEIEGSKYLKGSNFITYPYENTILILGLTKINRNIM